MREIVHVQVCFCNDTAVKLSLRVVLSGQREPWRVITPSGYCGCRDVLFVCDTFGYVGFLSLVFAVGEERWPWCLRSGFLLVGPSTWEG